MPDLETLIEKLEKAEAGSRELEGQIRLAIWPDRYELIDVPPDADGKNAGKMWAPKDFLKTGWQFPPKGQVNPYMLVNSSHPSDYFTASIDAAVALVERVLPGWRLDLTITRSESWAYLYDRDANHPRCVFIRSEDQATAPLAACIALLKAIHSKEANP